MQIEGSVTVVDRKVIAQAFVRQVLFCEERKTV